VKWATRSGPPPKSPKAFGRLAMSAVASRTKFRFEREEPPLLHGVLIGWPEEKSEQKLLAQQLAEICSAPCIVVATAKVR
jgi:hypothetical protein